jgi:surface antigen
MRGVPVLGLVLLLAACGSGRMSGPALGESRSIECAPYARQVSGIALAGDAADWWAEAAGRYRRSSQPAPGGVLVFRRSGRLPSGHVSVVRRVLSPREIVVTQANWVHHRIGEDDPVVDVSPGNDWSTVRVWWAPSGQLGTTPYATYGFVGPD